MLYRMRRRGQLYLSKLISFFPFLGVLGGLALSGCGQAGDQVTRAAAADTLLRANGTEPATLDPHVARGVPEIRILDGLLEGLVSIHPSDDGIHHPGVAERWEHDERYQVWTFYLREEAKWSNGDPVTAHHFVYSWQRAIEPAMGCDYADWFYLIEGAQAFHEGKTTDFSTVGVKALDDHTLRVHLIEPTPEWLKIIRIHPFRPVHPPTIEAHGRMDERATAWTRPGNFVGNGPFILESWQPNQRLTVKANPHYWNQETIELAGIEYYPLSNIDTENRAFEGGQVHVTGTVPLPKRDWYRSNAPDNLREDDYMGTYMISFNNERGPLRDGRVRRALSLAIDREEIVRTITKGGERPATGYVPDLMPEYETPLTVRFDVAEAQRLLAEAGYPKGEGFPELELLYNTSENHRIIAEALQQIWKTRLGVGIRLTNKEWQVYLDAVREGSYDMARSGWIGNLYPRSFLQNLRTGAGNNISKFSDAEYDRLMDLAAQEADPVRRMERFAEAERYAMEQAPVAPIFWYTNIYLIRPELAGWFPKLTDARMYGGVGFTAGVGFE